jgi:hypothetical protein
VQNILTDANNSCKILKREDNVSYGGKMVKRIQYNFLKQYSPIIGRKLKAYKDTNERGCLGELAKSLHIEQARLSNFIGGTIDLTPTYVYAFIKGGFIKVDELLRGKDLSTMTAEERDFWEDAKTLEDKELMGIFKRDPALADIVKKIYRKKKDPKPVLTSVFLSDEP